MGCLFACFTNSKHRKCRHLVNPSPSQHHRDGAGGAKLVDDVTTKQQDTEEPIKPIITESKEKKFEEQLSCNGKKKVTFNLGDEICKSLPAEEATDNAVENDEKKEGENKDEEPSHESKSVTNLISSNGASYPSNQRYQNYAEEECEELELINSDLNDDRDNVGNDGKMLVQEDSSESLFSLSIDSRKQSCRVEVGEQEVSSPMPKCGSPQEEPKAVGSNRNARNRNQYLDYVLNPVENLTQWKTVKTKSALPLHQQDKENINVEKDFGLAIISPEPSLKLLNNNAKTNVDRNKCLDPEIAVDASLSSWLVESETTPLSKGSSNSVGNSASGPASSPRNHEGRHVLGALTMNSLKQVSKSTSPKRGRRQNSNEMPITGTVGSYWRHTGQTVDSDSSSSSNGMLNTRSKSGEDERVKWNSTPFEAS